MAIISQSPSLGATTAWALTSLLLLEHHHHPSYHVTAFQPSVGFHTRGVSWGFPSTIRSTHTTTTTTSSMIIPSKASPLHMTVLTEEEAESASSSTSAKTDVPKTDVQLNLSKSGIYELNSKEEHMALLEQNPDQIIVLKFFAPWCRACKGLEPKFIQVSKDEKYKKLPIVFAQLSIAQSKEYVKSLGVLALPSVHIYGGEEGLLESFPCGPSKVPILKKKIAQVVNRKVDPHTLKLKPVCDNVSEDQPCAVRAISQVDDVNKTKLSVGDVEVAQETMDYLRQDIPYFEDLTDGEFNALMSKSTYSTFEAGAIIMREGMPGSTFYVIDNGQVEISVKGAFEDPLTTPSGYLGSVVNTLDSRNYFGERSLITGQVRAASIRAVEKTRCFTFEVADIPESSVLSGKARATQERLQQLNDKYAVDYYDVGLIDSQFKEASVAAQIRGSPNKPGVIKGVDTDDDIDEESIDEEPRGKTGSNDEVLSLLMRFKLLRHADKCFEYIRKTNPKFGDKGEVYRRSLLVSKLSSAQRSEFKDVFKLIDTSNDGKISVTEMKMALDAIGKDQRSETELLDIINKADPRVDGNTELSLPEFMGVMAEAEFYYLFKDTFATLDKNNTGYVQAGKIDNILCGLRDLISDDRKSIIDVDDKDMLIDYETFSRMMIGTW